MALTISSRIVSDVAIFDLSGRFSATDDSLRDLVNTLLDEGRLSLLINMAGVSYLGTWGLTQMVLMWTTIRKRGGTMGLFALTEPARAVLKLTKLDTVFPIYENELEALKPFSK